MIDGGELRLPERAGHRRVTIDRKFGGLGIERLAIMKLDARPEFDGDGLAVGRGGVRQRELRHDIQILVSVEQLVAKGSKDDAPDIGAGEGGIEHIRILGQPDAQRRLARRQSGQYKVGGRYCGPTKPSHGPLA